jgi:hypothetical protein
MMQDDFIPDFSKNQPRVSTIKKPLSEDHPPAPLKDWLLRIGRRVQSKKSSQGLDHLGQNQEQS